MVKIGKWHLEVSETGCGLNRERKFGWIYLKSKWLVIKRKRFTHELFQTIGKLGITCFGIGFQRETEDTFATTRQFWLVPIYAQFLCDIRLINLEPSPYQPRSPHGPEHQKNQKVSVEHSNHSADSIG
mgnify:FL=1